MKTEIINTIQTERLTLNKLNINDHLFIMELVNTPEWIKYIGDRNVKTIEEAKAYVQKIMANATIDYWIVKLSKDNTSIGIITLIKRDHLEHHDIGFAFLPDFTNKGYAYEAAKAVLIEITEHASHSKILAITKEENKNSINLLEKLGFTLEKKIVEDGSPSRVYFIAEDHLNINSLTHSFFDLFTNKYGLFPSLEDIHHSCLPETIIIKKIGDIEEIYNLDTFIKPRKEILSNGTLTEFEEYETSDETKVVGNIAQRFSKFKKRGFSCGEYFEGAGNKIFQFIKTANGWKISSVIWEDELWGKMPTANNSYKKLEPK